MTALRCRSRASLRAPPAVSPRAGDPGSRRRPADQLPVSIGYPFRFQYSKPPIISLTRKPSSASRSAPLAPALQLGAEAAPLPPYRRWSPAAARRPGRPPPCGPWSWARVACEKSHAGREARKGSGRRRVMARTVTDEARYRANRQGEIDSAVVYRAMAKAESDARLASVYIRLAEVEERHLGFWEDQLRALGSDPGPRRPSWRARAMRLLAHRFGAQLVLPTVATLERVDQENYDDQTETQGTGMPEDERSHARVLRFIAGGSPVGVAGETLGKLEGRHRAPGGNALRAAVLGANDGLTSNLALVMGVAGSRRDPPD